MATPTAFSGFPKKTIPFLRALKANNDRDWFAAHKAEYEAAVMEPARAFVSAMGEALRRLSPAVRFDPRPNGSLFRVYRDVRFSTDKSPYKTHLGIFFWEGNGPRMACPGYYFHLEPPALILGGGLYVFPKPLLQRYRRAVVDPEYGPELAAIVKKITRRPSFTLGGEHYKRVPAGYDADPAAAALLLHNGLYAGWEGPIPAELHSPVLIGFCLKKFIGMEPMHRWLSRLARGDFEP